MESMRPDYKNWVPRGMLYGLIAGTAVTLVFWILFGIAGIGTAGTLKTVLAVTFEIVSLVLLAITCWVGYLYSSFSYNGSRQISRKVVEGIAGYVELPEGGVGLDVGYGSGALTIACAKRSHKALWSRLIVGAKSMHRTICSCVMITPRQKA